MVASVPWLVMSLLGYVRVAVSSVRLFRPCSRPSQAGSAESLGLADRFRVFSLVSPAAKYNTGQYAVDTLFTSQHLRRSSEVP